MKREYQKVDEFLDDLHEEVSLKEFVMDLGIFQESDFRGQMVKCCFHEDDTPSLQISDKFFRCYAGSCGVKGDIVSFIRLYQNLDFLDAVKYIANHYNIEIKSMYYQSNVIGGKMKEEWQYYLDCMDNAPKEAQEMKRIFFPHELGYDPKMQYVVLPFTGKTGNILGFTKRRVDELHESKRDEITGKYKNPKWWHSPLGESLVGQCHNVWNLFDAQKHIRAKNAVIVVEGPKDAIAFERSGFPNVVGVCGTSNAMNIWDVILPAKDIIIAYDGDDVGVGTVIKNICYLASIHDLSTIYAIEFPMGLDPMDVLNRDGKEALASLYSKKIPAVDFVCKHGTRENIQELYSAVPKHDKLSVLARICALLGFSTSEAESYLSTDRKTNEQNQDEKNMLIDVIMGNAPLKGIKPDKAAKILKMKYGINPDNLLQNSKHQEVNGSNDEG